MIFEEVLISDEQLNNRRFFNKYLRKINKLKNIIRDSESREHFKKKQLKLKILIEFKY